VPVHDEGVLEVFIRYARSFLQQGTEVARDREGFFAVELQVHPVQLANRVNLKLHGSIFSYHSLSSFSGSVVSFIPYSLQNCFTEFFSMLFLIYRST